MMDWVGSSQEIWGKLFLIAGKWAGLFQFDLQFGLWNGRTRIEGPMDSMV